MKTLLWGIIIHLGGLFLITTTLIEDAAAASLSQGQHPHISKRDPACSSILIISGDSCESLASRCGITSVELASYNPRNASLCHSLEPGTPVCCSPNGTLRLPPEPSKDGLCYNYTIQADDTCEQIARGYAITRQDIETYNLQTWGWYGCDKLQQGAFICLSAGSPPMPMALPNAVCGPQVPGTTRPSNLSDLISLNPCPSSQCCDMMGQCDDTAESCASSMPTSSTGTVTRTASSIAPWVTSFTTLRITVTTNATTTKTLKTPLTEPTGAVSSSSRSTTTSHSTTSASPTATESKTWSIAIYTEKDCAGDYYVVEGHNLEVMNDRCIGLHSGLNTSSDSSLWCRWYTNGGFSWADCDSSPLKSPKSWFIRNGYCEVSDTENCDWSDGYGQLYGTVDGCQNWSEDNFDVPVWGSMHCTRRV